MFNLFKSMVSSQTRCGILTKIDGERATGLSGFTAIVSMLPMIVVLAICFAGVTSAQVLYGTLAGNITDSGDAGLPGAKVQITNLGTGDTKTATTDERGAFTFSSIQPGTYRILVTSSGFKSTVNEHLVVVANDIVRFDAKLEVGDVKATVDVSGTDDTVLTSDRSDRSVIQKSSIGPL